MILTILNIGTSALKNTTIVYHCKNMDYDTFELLFPVSNETDLQVLETKLRKDFEYRKLLVSCCFLIYHEIIKMYLDIFISITLTL